MKKIVVLAIACALVSFRAFAGTMVYATGQKGSLLIFPDIDVRAGRTTLVRVTNDGDVSVSLRCWLSDFEHNRIGFVVNVTPHQPMWFDAATGEGTTQVAPFPAIGRLTGELRCVAVDTLDSPIVHNHLTGAATVLDFFWGTAYEYAAAAFYLRTPGPAGELPLDGNSYDPCGQYLLGQFSPIGATVNTSRGVVVSQEVRLVVSSCTEDLRQDLLPVTTMLGFDIWNANEVKFTGAYECADSWHEVIFGGPSLRKGANRAHFLVSSLGTSAASYRVQGIKSATCDGIPPWRDTTEAVGLVGVQVNAVSVGGVGAISATSLVTAGRRIGAIRYDPGNSAAGTPEARPASPTRPE